MSNAGPVSHRVQQGECIASIATRYGYLPDVLWLHDANSDLRQKRGSGDVLKPGDVVEIPEIGEKSISGGTGSRHQFRRKGSAFLHIRIQVPDETLEDEEYELTVGGTTHTGTVGSDGEIDVNIPADAASGTLTLLGRTFEISLGSLDPADTVTGVQARLNQLGYSAGAVDDDLGPRTEACLKAFQEDNELEATGTMDAATQQKLTDLYGA